MSLRMLLNNWPKMDLLNSLVYPHFKAENGGLYQRQNLHTTSSSEDQLREISSP